MKIYLTDQSKHLSKHLDLLKTTSIMSYNKKDMIEKTSNIPININKSLKDFDTSLFFNYKIFPGHIMTYLTQWKFENREMQLGDIIVQQVFIPPIKTFSQKIIFGVRINEIINQPSRVGFSYETLEGHAEKGISTFTLEKTENDQVIIKIHTFSKPGNLLAQILAPFFLFLIKLIAQSKHY